MAPRQHARPPGPEARTGEDEGHGMAPGTEPDGNMPGEPQVRADALRNRRVLLDTAAQRPRLTKPPRPGNLAGQQAGRHRGKPTVTPTARQTWTPSAMRRWIPQHNGLQRYKATHHGTEKKQPASARIRS
jgi:hypothetical protein